ncbi:MAG: glutamine-synthetase adenylyltransferase, partial [Caulobacteraceae bacterium]|nr:glutamine-synthetase adenylyltransferase [Caulobacter sp.]
ALAALAAAGRVEAGARAALDAALVKLRGWEHRVQMRGDEQTHRLPEAPAARAAVAALAGEDLSAFDAQVAALRAEVADRTGALFAEAEPLASPLGPLVFTGVEDDPETLRTLSRMGFAEPARAAADVRGWHHGRIAATRTARGRELFTRLAPRLLEACAATGAADAAFARFGVFFAGLGSGVQVQSLLLAQPRLFELLVRVLALSPRLAEVLARRPAALDSLLDEGFFAPLDEEGPEAAVAAAAARARGFEGAMDAVRRAHRDEAFRIGMQALTGAADAPAAGRAFTRLADACVAALAPAALAEVERLGGAFPGEVAVVALGKFGGREMTAASDLDLMTLYRAAPDAASSARGWTAETVYARFTQRLAAALSAPTAEGGLYAVDLQLRPSGTAGPVSTSLAGFGRYHAEEAQTWEALALTRARVAWASSPALAADAAAAIEVALRASRDPAAAAADVRDMRALMARERPAKGRWDLKLAPGGLVDIEFAAQHLQIAGAAAGGPLRTGAAEALAALRAAGAAPQATLDDLLAAWRLQAALQQLLRLVTDAADIDPAREPAGLVALLCAAGGAADLAALERRLAEAQAAAHAAFLAVTA